MTARARRVSFFFLIRLLWAFGMFLVYHIRLVYTLQSLNPEVKGLDSMVRNVVESSCADISGSGHARAGSGGLLRTQGFEMDQGFLATRP